MIASMIEREARVALGPSQDRGGHLQPAGGRHDRSGSTPRSATSIRPANGLTASDLEIDSPYNTRLHTGLPPTPIASPGIASLRAALAPADVPYLYYVLCGADGHHRFSVDYDRFLRDKAECLG